MIEITGPSQISDPDQRVASVTSRSAAAANTHNSVSCRDRQQCELLSSALT